MAPAGKASARRADDHHTPRASRPSAPRRNALSMSIIGMARSYAKRFSSARGKCLSTHERTTSQASIASAAISAPMWRRTATTCVPRPSCSAYRTATYTFQVRPASRVVAPKMRLTLDDSTRSPSITVMRPTPRCARCANATDPAPRARLPRGDCAEQPGRQHLAPGAVGQTRAHRDHRCLGPRAAATLHRLYGRSTLSSSLARSRRGRKQTCVASDHHRSVWPAHLCEQRRHQSRVSLVIRQRKPWPIGARVCVP